MLPLFEIYVESTTKKVDALLRPFCLLIGMNPSSRTYDRNGLSLAGKVSHAIGSNVDCFLNLLFIVKKRIIKWDYRKMYI